MTQNAAVSAKLSTRARTLSTRRRNNIKARTEGQQQQHQMQQQQMQQQGQGHDLSAQDHPLNDRGVWVPAGQHTEYGEEEEEEEEGEEEEEDELDAPSHQSVGETEASLNGEHRGRNHEPVGA